MQTIIAGPIFSDLFPGDYGYPFPSPAAAFDLSNRAIAECFGMAIPPGRYTRVEILRVEDGWEVNLTSPEGHFRVQLDLDMETQKVFWLDDPPKPGQLRLVT